MRITITIFLLLLNLSTRAQQDSVIRLPVIAHVTSNSISLRWAPTKLSLWQRANTLGYFVEKYTLVKAGKLVDPPQKNSMDTSVLKPWPLPQWEPLVRQTPEAAVTAQALYGNDFSLQMDQTDVVQIFSKTQENEQRFSIALYMADRSFAVAEASGLAWTDRSIYPGDKYLYRVSVREEDGTRLAEGALLVATDEITVLPKPLIIRTVPEAGIVNIAVDPRPYQGIYTSFFLERSPDSLVFSRVSDLPYAQLGKQEDSPLVFLTDTLTGNAYYRVRGTTPFGQAGPPSSLIKTVGEQPMDAQPFITEVEPLADGSLKIKWEFPEEYTHRLSSFMMERAQQANGSYIRLAEAIRPTTREWVDSIPQASNYYKVIAQPVSGFAVSSPAFFAQVADSIPPAVPVGLKGVTDDFGNVTLAWANNTEPDILGYRVYKAHTRTEEPSLLNSDVLVANTLNDKEDLKTLDRHVYYYVMAIDKNQNHSGLSAPLAVSLPDKVPPQPPVWLPPQATEAGIILHWKSSASTDVKQYELYRKLPEETQWARQKIVPAAAQAVYEFTDTFAKPGVTYHYSIVAIDSANLESEPAAPIAGKRLRAMPGAVVLEKPAGDYTTKTILLKWRYAENSVKAYKVYRAAGDSTEQFALYKIVQPDITEWRDPQVKPGKQYAYFIVAAFEDGSHSLASETQSILY